MPHGIMSRIPRILPQNSSPQGTRCIQITIPDDDDYERDLHSVIYAELARWTAWQLDDGKNATKVAKVWKRALATFRHCDNKEPQSYGDYEDMPRFRDACEHDLFYKGCDDTEHQIAFLSDIPSAGQPGAGAPQPTPGGGEQAYCYQFQANNKLLLPTIVNSGDTIELTEAHGAGNDGGHTTWYCHDGAIFFAGACVPTGGPVGGDPMPGENHMSLIVDIDGTFYSLEHGAVTLPGGISNAQAVVQVNDSDISNNAGSYQACIKVTNNQIVDTPWIYSFDFPATPGGWVQEVFDGTFSAQWIAALGWQAVVPHSIGIKHTLPTGTIFTPGATIHSDAGDSTVQLFIWDHGSGAITNLLTISAPYTTAAGEAIYASKENMGTLPKITNIVVNGKGSNPFV